MRELIQLLVEQLVNNPGAVEVKETRVDAASVIELGWPRKISAGSSESKAALLSHSGPSSTPSLRETTGK